NGVIDLTYDQVSARDGIVGIFPKLAGGEEKPLATITSAASSPLAVKSIKLSEVDGVYLKAQLETVAPVPAAGDPGAAGLAYHLCLSAKQTAGPCTNTSADAIVWTVMAFGGF